MLAQGPCLWVPKKNSPKRKEEERKKERIIYFLTLLNHLVENHYKNGLNSVVYYYRLL